MTSEAGHVRLGVGKLGIDVAGHRDHHARGFLFRLLIAGEIALYMTEGALAAQGHAKRAHHGTNFFRLYFFHV